jgi:hypothetical protein
MSRNGAPTNGSKTHILILQHVPLWNKIASLLPSIICGWMSITKQDLAKLKALFGHDQGHSVGFKSHFC